MRKRNQFPSALKHGGHSGMTLLPGEDPVAFEKLKDELFEDLAPAGPLEEDIVTEIARLMWRKQNLSTYRMASRARSRFRIQSELQPQQLDARDLDDDRAVRQAALQQLRKELGTIACELVEIGDVGKPDHLLDELDLTDRLNGMMDRCLKRLLFVRGIKSLSGSGSKRAVPRERRINAT